ncbi:AAA family ATPase [Actinomadura madurae]|uniref:BTAD domain-containing putative transcriptional regulator n=1 Tax=Actinomadura madurae TaxID=1993 RepID=UPI000D93BB6F|nr:BTAD domain-containing putative transcriptional regulator [Actinomadura madurae]SPT51523.1 Probable regulatory protein embR [Actinomadura madurae]
MEGVRYEFRLLGPLEVRRDGVPVPIGAAKLRLLLASLLVDAGRVVTLDTLVYRLWGEAPPGRPRNALQNYVLRLRRAFGEDGGRVVVSHALGYSIAVDPDAMDLHRFAALVSRGRAALQDGFPERAAGPLREALDLCQGEPLSDLPPGLLPDVVAMLAEQRLDALELRIDADLALGRFHEVVPELRALVGAHPLRERFWAQRMRALYLSGRRGEALECYRTVASLLADELGVDPGADLQALHLAMLAERPGPDLTPVRRRPARGNLPAETNSFVGREDQLARTLRTLEGARLVTLTGVGGVGKTRLALRVAAEAAPAFADGAWLADLAQLVPRTEAEQLYRTIAESLGLHDHSPRSPADAVADHLRDRRLLLVLDNCEHLVEEVAALAQRLLCAAPALRILATSRERLAVPGEHVLLVPGLALPPGTGDSDEDRSEAVRLLLDRAAASAPEFGVTDRNRGAIVRLCRLLDGIPLAIELAAVRLSSMAVEEILDRLDDRFQPLSASPARARGRYRRTLRAVIGWSHGLCTEGERLLWARLSIFSGGFDLEAAEAVCAGGGVTAAEVADLLAGLVHKSIVMADGTEGRTRYRLLETIRRYGRQQLREAGAIDEFRLRHTRHYRDLTLRAAAHWCGPDEVDWLCRLRRDLPDLRGALESCATGPGPAAAGLDIVINLLRTRFWFFSGTLGEARHWLDQLSTARPGDAPDERETAAAAMRAFLIIVQGDRRAVPEAIAACRAAAAAHPCAPAVYVEGVHALLRGNDARSIALLARARAEFLAAGQAGDAHMATMFWAMAAAYLGDRDTAVHARDVYGTEAETTGAAWAASWALWTAGLAELRHGEPSRALAPLREALVRQHAIGDDWGPVWDVEALAWTAAAIGQHHRAAVLLGAAHRLRQATGVTLTGLKPFQAAHAEAARLIRGALTREAYAQAWHRGSADDDGVGLALTMVDEIIGSL